MVQNLQRIIGDYHNGGDKWQNTDRLQLTIRGGLGEIIGASPRLRLIFTVSLFLPSLFVSIFHCQPRGYISKDGIQTLLDAEREAQKIVQQAREYRTKRIRDAKSEAQKEIEEYRNQKEQEFKKFEAEHSSGYKKAEEDANKEAEVKLQEIKDAGNSKGAKVVEDLISALTDVKPEASEKILSQA
ncbi:H+-ATPase G subunit-domain-containing protein [Aspergillus flavus]|uniref:V-type proton ATPase subunit G n=1 Tax=Aspergillus flavus TaxID=5059 RepID=A0A5N6GQA6_ASPFL|nr:H+-ATPase G subunit-domain-containing protein [Aspergillus flavus]KOC12347.1 putative vacuolar ATP synthase subunit G [Aspergillus flavus AF70]